MEYLIGIVLALMVMPLNIMCMGIAINFLIEVLNLSHSSRLIDFLQLFGWCFCAFVTYTIYRLPIGRLVNKEKVRQNKGKYGYIISKESVDSGNVNSTGNVETHFSKYITRKFPSCGGSWKELFKHVYLRQLLGGAPSGLLAASLVFMLIGLPLFLSVWAWTVGYIFQTRHEFPKEKQYQNVIFGLLALCPFTYFGLFFLPCVGIFILLIAPFGILFSHL